MATKKDAGSYAATLATYEKLIASNPAIEQKGDKIPYTSLNGHMFSFLAKDGSLGFRLSQDKRNEFLEKYPSAELFQYGIVMKEYVKIPDQLLGKPEELKKYFDLSFAYAKSLKPKPTAKKKIAKKKK